MVKLVFLAAELNEDREIVLNGHKAPVLSVAFDPLDIYLASASCDGTVRIWRIDERKEVKAINTLAQCSDPLLAPSYCRLSWESNGGNFLAVPVDKEIRVYERNSWCLSYSLTCSSVNKPFDVCTFSPDCKLIAGGSKDGWIIIWHIYDRNPIYRIRDHSHSSICSLVWDPHQPGILIYANDNGSISMIKAKNIEISVPGALSMDEMANLMGCDEDGDTTELLNAAAAQAESSRLLNEDEVQGFIDDDSNDGLNNQKDDDQNSIDLSRIKSDYMSLNNEDQNAPPVETVLGIDPNTDVPIILNEKSISTTEFFSQIIQKSFQPGAMPIGFRERFMLWNRIGIVTQFRNSIDNQDDKEFNQGSSGSIEIEFHDTNLHHSLRLSNNSGYTMADLSLTALLLASKGSSDSTLADEIDKGGQLELSDISHIALLPLDVSNTGGGESSTEWTVTLSPGEACEAICLVSDTSVGENRGYSVIVTSKRILRIFVQPAPSLSFAHQSGNLHLLQITKLGLPPISIPGHNVLVMASHPSKPILAVVISNLTGEPQWRIFYLGGIVLGDNRSRIPSWLSNSLTLWQHLPLSPSHQSTYDRNHVVRLTWFGFSDTGNLFTHDSIGVVRRLIHGRTPSFPEFHWVPVCNSRSLLKPNNRRTDNYFIVSVHESAEIIGNEFATGSDVGQNRDKSGLGYLQAIYCKASKWPRVFPRPVLSTVPLRLPLCILDTDQGDLEENYLRNLINNDWPIWGPNPKLSSANNNNDEDVEVCNVLESLNVKCLTKRKAILLRLFALAAKLDSDWASLLIAQLMPDAATVQLAIRYAGRLRRQNLAHRLAGIALDKEKLQSQSQENDEYLDEESDQLVQKYSQRHHVSTNRKHSIPDNSHIPRFIQEDQEYLGTSIISSGTDDTHDEHNLSGLPLTESEPISQSILSTTESSRNPFRVAHYRQKFEQCSEGNALEEHSNKINSDQRSNNICNRSRGSDIFDNWIPKKLISTETKPQKLKNKSMKQARKCFNDNSRKHKVLKVSHREDDDNDQEFIDWFEENRGIIEESNPEMSVEDLLQIGRVEFHASHVSDMSGGKENISQKRLDEKLDHPLTNNKTRHTEFNEKATKRLSNFEFELK